MIRTLDYKNGMNWYVITIILNLHTLMGQKYLLF